MTIYKINNFKRISAFIFICLLAFLSLTIKNIFSKKVIDHYTIYGVFDDIDGIFTNSDVRLSGKTIGKVIGIELDNNMSVIVKMQIESAYKIPTDSSISIHTNGLLGNKYLEIVAGGMEEYLEANNKITYSQSSINIMELLSKYIDSIKVEQKK